MVVLGFEHYHDPGKRLAAALGCPYAEVVIHRFPDGESKVTLPPLDTAEVVICRTLDRPNSKLIELFMISRTLREQGIDRITLVAPYLCYMRQDKAFNPGEIVTQKVIGQWLGEMVDKLVTVDPHLHRIHDLGEVLPDTENVTLTAAPLIADFLGHSASRPLLLGPDEESRQWVQRIAERAGLDWAVAKKIRQGDQRVSVQLPRQDVAGRHVVIIDDVASTGHTLADAAERLYRAGAKEVSCFVTHPLYCEGAEQLLRRANVSQLWSSDSILHRSNVVSLAPLLAAAVKS